MRRAEFKEKEDGSTDTFPSGLHPHGIVCQGAVGKILELSCSEARHAVLPMLQTVCPAILVRGLSFQGRFSVPMPVLQPCPQGVQSAVIVPRITFALDSIVIIEEMAVRVEQSFDFQYLLQLGQRPAILVMLSRVAAVLFRQYIDIIDELPIAACLLYTSPSPRD